LDRSTGSVEAAGTILVVLVALVEPAEPEEPADPLELAVVGAVPVLDTLL
jgi:hypothetical protein